MDAFFDVFLLFLDPLGVEDLIAVDEGELVVHKVYALLVDGYGFLGLFYEGEEVLVGKVVKAVEAVNVVGLDEEVYLPKGLEVSKVVGSGCLDEEVALFPALVWMEVRVEGLGNGAVEVPQFCGLLLAQAGGVEEVFGFLEFGFLLLYFGLIVLLGGLDLVADAAMVYGGVVVDVGLGKVDFQLG